VAPVSVRAAVQVLGGLLDEAHMLREAGAQPGDTPATRAIGYRQALAWLNGVAAARACDAAAVRQLAASIQGPTRRLQRAQLVFHRGDDAFAWIDATPGPAAAAEDILTRLSQATHTGAPAARSVACHVVCLCGVNRSLPPQGQHPHAYGD